MLTTQSATFVIIKTFNLFPVFFHLKSLSRQGTSIISGSKTLKKMNTKFLFDHTKTSLLWNISKIPSEILLKLSIYDPKFWNFSWTNLLTILRSQRLNLMIQLLNISLWKWNSLRIPRFSSSNQVKCSFCLKLL